MKVKPLPFNHNTDNYRDAVGISDEMIAEFTESSDVHTHMFIKALAEDRPIDPFMLRHACSYFVDRARESLTLNTLDNSIDKKGIEEFNSMILSALTFGLQFNTTSEVVEHVEKNFIALYDQLKDDGVTARLSILCVLSCYNVFILDEVMEYIKRHEKEEEAEGPSIIKAR